MTDRLDEIEARANAATEGPWVAEYSGEQGDCVLPHDAQSTREAVAVTRLYHRTADAEFIAAARADVPALTAALRAVLELADHEIPSIVLPEFYDLYRRTQVTNFQWLPCEHTTIGHKYPVTAEDLEYWDKGRCIFCGKQEAKP